MLHYYLQDGHIDGLAWSVLHHNSRITFIFKVLKPVTNQLVQIRKSETICSMNSVTLRMMACGTSKRKDD